MDLEKMNKDLIESIQNHSVDIDTDELWKGIEQKRKKDKRYYVIPFFLVLFLGIGYYFVSSSDGVVNNTPGEYVQTDLQNKKEEKHTADTQVDTNELVRESSKNVAAKEDQARIVSSVSSEKTNTLNELQDFNSQQKVRVEKPTDQKRLQSTIVENSAFQRISENTNTNNNSFETISESAIKHNTNLQTTEEKVVTESMTHANVLANVTNTQNHSNAITPNQNETIFPDVNTDRNNIARLLSIEYLKPSLLTHYSDLPQPAFTNSKQIYALQNQHTNPYELTLFTSYGILCRGFSDRLESVEYQVVREATETILEEISFGAGFNYYLNSSFYLNASLQYSKISERFENSEERQEAVKGTTTVLQILGPDPGMVQNIEGTATGTQNFRDYYTYYNQLHFLDVPLVLGYRKPFTKFSLGVEAGILVNLNLKFDGHILDGSFNVVENPDYFSNRIGLRYILGSKITYSISDKVSVAFQPRFIYQNGNISTDQNPLAQKYQVFKMQFAFDYKF